MIDLGTFGGARSTATALNNKGQVVGTSNLKGDQTHHAFLWEHCNSREKRGSLKDLGTLGGENSKAYWINDAGEIAGNADTCGSKVHHAVLWKGGKIKDLGFAHGWPCSTAIDINTKGQVIIETGICGVGGGPGLLWEDGKLYDLNTLISPDPDIKVGDVSYINDRGEIAATGVLSNGDHHEILLVPVDKYGKTHD